MSNTHLDSSVIGSALADAVARVGPSVVHVTAGARVGSGVVWSASTGLIVTTSRLFHEQPDEAIVVRGEAFARGGTLVGVDEATELALVRVAVEAAAPLIEATWSEGARPGLFVAPVARTATGLATTFGVVRSVGPAWVTPRGGTVDAYIDVDGTLPPGFSGGPLIDFAGVVLGVDTRGLLPGGATLPTATVRRVLGQLERGESAAPGHLGVAIQEVALPESLRVEPRAARGLLVTGLAPHSAAASAGLEPGDVIVAIDSRPTLDHAHLLAALAGKAGQVVQLRVARHGQTIALEATPAPRTERRREQRTVRGWWGRGCR